MNHTFRDVDAWAIETGEPKDTVRSLRRIPARLGLLDADLGTLSADPVRFEKEIAGQGYARVSCARDKKAAGRREDSRVRALLKRYHAAQVGTGLRDEAVRARYSALMSVIAEHEGQPGRGALWNIGRHRSLCGLRARARKAPEDLTQTEIDRIGREMTSNKRKGLRKTVGFLNSLAGLTDEIPQLREFLPSEPLAPPAGSSWARRMDWEALPTAFRSSFETAADACLAGNDDLAEQMLARIEAGEDPEMVMAEADALGIAKASSVGKPTAAREQYQRAVAWLVRSWENEGGNTAGLTDLRSLFGRATSAPSQESFFASCGSESTLGLLLRVLGQHAPSVGLADGRALRQAYYAKRSCRGTEPSRGRRGQGASVTEARNWPPEWQAFLPGLRGAAIRESSINRHVASINRCAALGPDLPCPPRLGWLFAWEPAKWLQTPDTLRGQESGKRSHGSQLHQCVGEPWPARHFGG